MLFLEDQSKEQYRKCILKMLLDEKIRPLLTCVIVCQRKELLQMQIDIYWLSIITYFLNNVNAQSLYGTHKILTRQADRITAEERKDLLLSLSLVDINMRSRRCLTESEMDE